MYFSAISFKCFDIHFREKLYEISFKNPIKDGILRKCPQMADELEDPYSKRLSGSEILSILCEEKCDRQQDIKPKGTLNFESKYLELEVFLIMILLVILFESRINITTSECPEILSEVCELVDCLKPKASHLCPNSCPRGKNRTENVIFYDSYICKPM